MADFGGYFGGYSGVIFGGRVRLPSVARRKKGCKTDLVNQLGDPNPNPKPNPKPNPNPNQDVILGPSWLLIS